MIISVLKETKEREGRVALTPANVKELTRLKHKVYVQKNAGIAIGFTNKDYRKAGGRILASTRDLIKKAKLILKVKEPTFKELNMMKEGQIVFSFLHLAPEKKLIRKILQKKIVALAYETVELKDGSLPLLAPMSEIAGRLATQNGAHFLRADKGGKGVLIGGTSRAKPAVVLILGGGVVGENAAKVAMGMGGTTCIVDISQKRLKTLKKKYRGHLKTSLSTPKNIRRLVPQADLLIGAVLLPGAHAPKLVPRSLVKKMKKGSVIVDVSIDQGGCVETSVVTSHNKPVVTKHGVLHYGVPNMPGSVPMTGTLALTNATLPYIKKLANLGLAGACRKHPEMRLAINCAYGEIVHPGLLT